MKNKLKAAVLGGAALATAANAQITGIVPTDTVDFSSVVSYAAPIALAVVVSVAGIRVVIKLINRAAGK